MKFRTMTLAFAVAVGLGLAVTPGVAQAAVSVPGPTADLRRVDCAPGISYLRIFNNTGTLCFADAGSLPVNIEGVRDLDSGNNAGRVTWTRDGATFVNDPFVKRATKHYSPPVRIVGIVIN